MARGRSNPVLKPVYELVKVHLPIGHAYQHVLDFPIHFVIVRKPQVVTAASKQDHYADESGPFVAIDEAVV